MLAWFAVLALSCSWLFGQPVYTSANLAAYCACIAAGVLLMTAAARRDRTGPGGVTDRRLLIPLLVAAVLLPFPYRVGPGLAVLAVALSFGGSGGHARGWLQAGVTAVALAGFILLAQSALPPLYFALSASVKELPWIAPLAAAALNLFGLPAAWERTAVTVLTMRDQYVIPTTWEHLALYPLGLFVVGGTAWHGLRRGSAVRTAAALLALAAGYSVLRLIGMAIVVVQSMLFVEYEADVSYAFVFWTPWMMAVSLLPLPLCAGLLVPPPPPAGGAPSPVTRRALACVCAAGFFLIAAVHFQDPGTPKAGRLLIDEGHSEWERTTRPYDTTWYGQESGYNYAAIADFLRSYYRVETTFAAYTPELLREYDLLMLKIPTVPFSAAERAAIVEFVRNGGGLLMLGEHTNVFGSGAYLNPIAREFGLRFRFDAIFDIEKIFAQVYRRPPRLAHPIVQRLPPFLFETSCSIEPLSFRAEPVILSTGLKSLDVDYSSRNFYPPVKDATDMRFGPFFQMMAVKAGAGRVAAFTDSTTFSNFSAFIPGKHELMLASLEWLNRRNRLTWLNVVFLTMAALAFTGLLIPARGARGGAPHWIAWGAASVAVALGVWAGVNRVAYPVPTPHTAPTWIAFDRHHSDYELPTEGFIENPHRSFAVFYQWVLRLGYFPAAVPSLREATERGRVIVVINPTRTFSAGDRDRVSAYVRDGGSLLLLDEPENAASTANQLLSAFDMAIDGQRRLGAGIVQNQAGIDICTVSGAAPVSGGSPLLTLAGDPVLASRSVGKGTVAVFSAAGRFTDREMGGGESVTPGIQLLRVYALQFGILRGLVEQRLSEELLAFEPPQVPVDVPDEEDADEGEAEFDDEGDVPPWMWDSE